MAFADLGRDDEVFALLLAQEVAVAVLALAVAVKGCGVVVADAGVPGGLEGVLGLGFADGVEELADGGAAEAEGGELDAGAQGAGDGRHGNGLSLYMLSEGI